jgi:hypothetical protein
VSVFQEIGMPVAKNLSKLHNDNIEEIVVDAAAFARGDG